MTQHGVTRSGGMIGKQKSVTANNANALINFYGAGYSDGKISLLLEYMDRGSIEDYIKTFGVMSEIVLRLVYRQVLHGLNTLHGRKQVHRDIKPGNMLINHNGEVRLADFGILANLSDEVQLCKTFCGTFDFDLIFCSYQSCVFKSRAFESSALWISRRYLVIGLVNHLFGYRKISL